MDDNRFDLMTRGLATLPTRRSVAGGLVALGLGFVVSPWGDAALAGKQKCKPCQRKKHGKCRGHKPDGTPCEGDRECCDGKCLEKCGPTEQRDPATCGCCVVTGQTCGGTSVFCCSGLCEIEIGSDTGVCVAN
ncbi:MAG: hypothetical protein U0031_03070 [Thermomicrobiales bacterium]